MTEAFQKYVCIICGYIYDEALGDPDSGLAPGTRFADIPDNWECPDCGVTKQDFSLLTTAEPITPKANVGKTSDSLKSLSQDAIVILGGGMAAWEVAKQLRQQDISQAILMITHCAGDVYSKPQLSTALNGQQTPDALVNTPAAEQAATLNVTLLPFTRVLQIDTEAKRLILPIGGLGYSKLVLALGAQQKVIPFSGSELERVHRINHLEEYRAFRAQLDEKPKAQVAILGSGLIGCEFADDLLSAGHSISLIDFADRPLSHLLPAPLSQELAKVFEAKGVRLHSGTTITAIHLDGDTLQIQLENGQVVSADFLISAVGLQPNIDVAKKAGLQTQRGILVDDSMRTSNPDVFALGDCTEHRDTDGRHVLLPYIKPLLKQAKVIAGQIAEQDIRYDCQSDVVVIKTPSLPLSVCPPPTRDEAGSWQLLESEGGDMAMAYYHNDQMTGFALSGRYTKKANSWFKDIKLAG